jgi:accessory gene regulator protein AgrB
MKRTIARGLLGGSVVTAVVILSEVAGPLVGGVFAAAPAIWSSSLYVTYRTHGMEFSRSLTWNFMQTGIITIIPFAMAARYFFSATGIWLGTLLAYVAISPLAYLAWRLNNRTISAERSKQ